MSKQAKFTRGPWEVASVRGRLHVFTRETGDAVCEVYDWSEGGNEADAFLIAAAPDLLDALRHLVHWHDQIGPRDIAKAEAAIAKAEGKQ